MLFVWFCRYHEMFFMIDTCQGASLYEKFYSPNILAVASSLVGEDSLSVSCKIFVIVDYILFYINVERFNITDYHIKIWSGIEVLEKLEANMDINYFSLMCLEKNVQGEVKWKPNFFSQLVYCR